MGRGGDRVLTQVAEVTAAARALSGVPVLSASPRERVDALVEVARARRALDAAHLHLVRSLAGEDSTTLAGLGGTSVANLLTARLKQTPGRSKADVAAAAATCPDVGPLPGMGAALAAGEVSLAHVDVAVATLARVPVDRARAAAPLIDAFLVEQSTRWRPKECEALARSVLDRVDPDRHDGGYDAAADQRRSFTMTTDCYGMLLVRGQLDPLTGAALKAAVDHHSAPTPAAGDGSLPVFDARTAGQRRCDALAVIAAKAMAASDAGTRGGEPPRVVVHATVDQVRGTRGAGWAECEQTGPLPPAAFRRVLCDCVLERVLLGPDGAVLNLGRTVRTATPAQRRALAARDRGCVIPGCTVPAKWCDVHHVTPWVHGGRTDLGGLVLACGPHHADLETGEWTITLRGGVPWVTPPSAVDPQQRPVRNTWWDDHHHARAVGDQIHLSLHEDDEESSDDPDPPDDG